MQKLKSMLVFKVNEKTPLAYFALGAGVSSLLNGIFHLITKDSLGEAVFNDVFIGVLFIAIPLIFWRKYLKVKTNV